MWARLRQRLAGQAAAGRGRRQQQLGRPHCGSRLVLSRVCADSSRGRSRGRSRRRRQIAVPGAAAPLRCPQQRPLASESLALPKQEGYRPPGRPGASQQEEPPAPQTAAQTAQVQGEEMRLLLCHAEQLCPLYLRLSTWFFSISPDTYPQPRAPGAFSRAVGKAPSATTMEKSFSKTF